MAPWLSARNSGEITSELLSQSALIILGGAREPLTPSESEIIYKYVANGGSVLVLGYGGSSAQQNDALNAFLQSFGVAFNADTIARHSFHKYFHPKQVTVGHITLLSSPSWLRHRCSSTIL
jgi:hypothetical protein